MNTLTYNGNLIKQREDGYVNLTQMCQANDKKLANWLKNKSTNAYIQELESDILIRTSELMVVIKGGVPEEQGTYAHPLSALHLAQWISPKFHLWCNMHIKTLMETGSTSINDESAEIGAGVVALTLKQEMETYWAVFGAECPVIENKRVRSWVNLIKRCNMLQSERVSFLVHKGFWRYMEEYKDKGPLHASTEIVLSISPKNRPKDYPRI